MKDDRIYDEMERTFGRPLTAGERAAMLVARVRETIKLGGAQKRRRAMRKAAYSPLVISEHFDDPDF